MNFRKNSKGITLIALVITIIVLLILAQVSLNLITGSDGIMQKAKWSEYVTEYENVHEAVQLYAGDYMIDKFDKNSKIVRKIDKVASATDTYKELKSDINKYPIKSEQIDIIYDSKIIESLKNTIIEIENLDDIYDLSNPEKVKLYDIDLEKINVQTKRNYVINAVSGMVYSVEAENYKEKDYHTPRIGISNKSPEAEKIKIDLEEGRNEIIIDADQLVCWDSVEIVYEKYIPDSVACTAQLSQDGLVWNDNVTLEESVFEKQSGQDVEIKKINCEDSQFLKLIIDLTSVDGEISNVDYILVNFYKYKDVGIIPDIIGSDPEIKKDDNGFIINEDDEEPKRIIEKIKIPDEDGEYKIFVDTGSIISVLIKEPDGNTIEITGEELSSRIIKPGSEVIIERLVSPGQAVEPSRVLKKDKVITEKDVTKTAINNDENWITKKSEKYVYNNGGSGYWYSCSVNDNLVETDGIISINQNQRIKVTYQTYSGNKKDKWSREFTDVQKAENKQYLKVIVQYQVKEGNEYQGDLNNNTIKVVLNDGSWKISFYDEKGEFLFYKRVYFSESNKTVNFVMPEFEQREKENFVGWKIDGEIILPKTNYNVKKDIDCIATWEIKKYEVKYNINGGTSGSIESQWKVHDEDLIIDTTIPNKPGHDFLGWATTADATVAEYESGSTYTKNEAVNLYAVWKKVIGYSAIGDYVDLGNDPLGKGNTTSSWRVFYTDDEYVYIIAADRILTTYMPDATGISKKSPSGVGSTVDRQTLLDYFDTFSETSKWNFLANGVKSATVMGTVTYDLFQKSWNNNPKSTSTVPTTPSWVDFTTDLYTVSGWSWGYWFANPSSNEKQLWYYYKVGNSNFSSKKQIRADGTYSNNSIGIRPVVRVPLSDNRFVKNSSVWTIESK